MRKSFILEKLEKEGVVIYKGKGNSMTPRIKSGDKVTVKRVHPSIFRKGDMVYCKVKGSYFLHLITAIKGDQYQISNNHGHVNGWITNKSIFGLCVAVEDQEIISYQDIFKRVCENVVELPTTVLASSSSLEDKNEK